MNTTPIRFSSWDQFRNHVYNRYRDMRRVDPSLRLGQVLYNELYRHRPDISEQIRATELDPFHHDSIPTEVDTFIKNNW